MKQGAPTWGTRLSDAMRAALADGDVATARHLALHGDGQARDLAREYALMVRGLGLTLQVLLRVMLQETAWRQTTENVAAEAAPNAQDDLDALLRRLLQGLRGGTNDPPRCPQPARPPRHWPTPACRPFKPARSASRSINRTAPTRWCWH